MEPVEAVSSDGTAIEGYLVSPGRPEALSPRQSRVRDTLKLRGKMPHLEAKPELVVIAASWNEEWKVPSLWRKEAGREPVTRA